MPINSKFNGSTDEFDFENRITGSEFIQSEDTDTEFSLRPRSFDEYIGQEKTKQNLLVFINAAKSRGNALDHVLFSGPPGLGKTTLSCIVASELGVTLRVTSGPAIERTGDLAAMLTTLDKNDILFIDEIHRLSRQVEEVLYSAMEDFRLDMMMGTGPSARSIRITLKPFTLIGATTRAGQLSAPLRDRFGMNFRLEMYTPEELAQIVSNSASRLGFPINAEGAYEIARRSRGTPRIANRFLKRVRDFATVQNKNIIDREIAEYSFKCLDVDSLGLDAIDRRMLSTIIKLFSGGPVGLDTLAAVIGEESVTLEDVYEPYLLQLGFINRTPRGRMALPPAYKYLGLPVNGQQTLI